MWSFIVDHPLYIPFILFNIWLVYRVVRAALNDDKDDEDHDDEGGGIDPVDPDLDLPPGVSLSRDPELVSPP